MLIFITIHNEGFSQVKETKITALFETSTYQQRSEIHARGASAW